MDVKETKFIDINDIKIINEGSRAFKTLSFAKDQEKSSNELCFFDKSKITNDYELFLQNGLEPNKSLNCSISMNINNPQPNQEYKMLLYAKENDKIISDPFEIIIKTNKDEDPMEQKEIQANAIYEEIKNQFSEHEDLINKDVIIETLLKNDLNKDVIINDINNKIKEKNTGKKKKKRKKRRKYKNKNQKEKNEKAEKVYEELNFDNVTLDKKEVLDYIKEKEFDIIEVQKWIDEKKPKINPPPGSGQEHEPNEVEEKVNQIYNELEETYGISGFFEEEVTKGKIRELKLDRILIKKWIEDTLIDGK